MSATQTSQTSERTFAQWFPKGKCQCGCGADVAGSFKQGHDQRLKGQLLRRINNRQAFAKQAVRRMVAMGWTERLSSEDRVWAAFAVRTRCQVTGQFVKTLHVDECEKFVTANGVSHSHEGCAKVEGDVTFESEASGWLCGNCVRVGGDTGWVV